MTPAHDPNDFEMGQRHSLGQIKVIGPDGKMTTKPALCRLEVLECRRQVVEDQARPDCCLKSKNTSAVAAAISATRW